MENNSIEANMSTVVFHIAEVCGKRNMSVFRFVYFILILFPKKPFFLAINHCGNYRLVVFLKNIVFINVPFFHGLTL